VRLLTRIRSYFDLQRAGSAYARGDHAQAYEIYREIVDNLGGSTRVGVLNRLGMLSFALGDKQTAKGWYEQAIAFEPDEPRLYMNLANALDDLGDGPAARAAYERALARSRRPDLLYNFAVYLAKSDPHAATQLFKESLIDPDAMREVELPAEMPLQSLVALGNREELFEDISRYLYELEAKPIGLEPWSVANQHAILLSRSGRSEQALARFQEILEKWPNSSGEVRYNLGMALTRAGQWESARKEFLQVDHPFRHFGLALIHEKTGSVAEAVSEYGLYLEEMRDLEHDPIMTTAPDILSEQIAQAEAFIAAHPAIPDDRPHRHD